MLSALISKKQLPSLTGLLRPLSDREPLNSLPVHLLLIVALIASVFSFSCIRSRGSVVSLRSDGCLLLDGNPFFPIGIYHVSWSVSVGSLNTDLPAIAALGWNTIHASYTTDADFKSFLNAAILLNIHVIAEATWNSDGTPSSWMTTFKGYPAILAWNIGDDVHNFFTPDQMLARRAAIHALDPNHPTVYTVYSPTKWGPYLNVGDILMPYSTR